MSKATRKNCRIIWDNTETGLSSGLPCRFFVYDHELDDDGGGGGPKEVDLFEFEEAGGDITLERHTVRENGVSQICLTKMPRG